MIHIPQNPSAYIAANHVVGLSLDRLPSGQVLACEVRQDEAGELRVPLGSMSTADFYTLAARLRVDVLPSQFASRAEILWHQQAKSHAREKAKEERTAELAEMAAELREARNDGKGEA